MGLPLLKNGDENTLESPPETGEPAHHAPGCQGHHDHAAHADLDSSDGRRRVAIACALTAVFTVVEAVGGVLSGSLALLADAAHMFTDSASLALAWFGYLLAAKAPDETRSYGFGRVRVLAAFTNGVALIALAVWILVEGLLRLINPQPVVGEMMIWIAIGGLIINLIAAYVLHGGDSEDINLSGALWHVIGDLLGSVAAIIAALVIIATNWTPVDPILSMLVLTPASVRTTLTDKVNGLQVVQSVNVWLLTEGKPVVTVCISPSPQANPQLLQQAVKHILHDHLQVHLSNVEITDPQPTPLSTAVDGRANDSAFCPTR